MFCALRRFLPRLLYLEVEKLKTLGGTENTQNTRWRNTHIGGGMVTAYSTKPCILYDGVLCGLAATT